MSETLPDGILPHRYFNASDDPAAYDADMCERQAVTVAWAYDHLVDQAVWLWVDPEMTSGGDDPWVMLSGIDKTTSGGNYIIEFGRTGERTVRPDFRLFAQRRDLTRLGFPPGIPGGPRIPSF